MDRSLALPALVLLDELGAGTDPLEGGALGVAIIEHFRTRGAIVISTTHYEALKTYAATTPGVTAAAFGFTPDTYEPTYHIQYGSPGRSLALEMAGRLGLNGTIIDSARKNLSEREAQLAEHLAKVDTDLRALEHERRLVKREREALGEADSRARVREDALRQREETFKLRLNEKLDERLRDARAEIDAVVADLKKQAAALAEQAARNAAAAPSTGDTGPAARRCARRDRRARRQVSQRSQRRRSPPRHRADAHVVVGDRVVHRRARPRRHRRERARSRSGSGSARQTFPRADERAARARRRAAEARTGGRSRERAASAARRRVVERAAARRQHRRSGARSPREISRRKPARRAADGAADSRLRHRAG